MTLVKVKPQITPDLECEFDDLFDTFWDSWREKNKRIDYWPPRVDLSETTDEYGLQADLPGVDKKDISVTFEKNILKIEGEKKQIPKEKEKNYYQSERTFGHFSRSFRLPATVEAENISASYRKGVLSLTVPKAEVSKPKQIDINVE